MGRSDFKETQFVCAICGAKFKALTGPTPPAVTYCGDCGLKYSADQLRKLADKKSGGCARRR